MNLSTIDRLVRKLEPVDALVEKLCGRLLPHKVAHATIFCSYEYVCYYSQACGVKTGVAVESCCVDPWTGANYDCSCGCVW